MGGEVLRLFFVAASAAWVTMARNPTLSRGCTMRDISIQLTHRPGELARVANALSRLNVNLKSLAGLTLGNQGVIHLMPDDMDAARSALQQANIRFDENEIVTILLENKAGEVADLAGKLSNAG